MKLIFSDNDSARVAALREAFAGRGDLHVVQVKRTEELRIMPELDALYLSVMGAERWGAYPVVHKAQVLKVTDKDRAEGWPPYVIAGVAMKSDDPRDPKFELGLIVSCAVEAAKQFNLEGSGWIDTIGFGGDWIGLKKMSPEEAAEIIRRSSESPQSK
jgi:hypothetical protein